MIILSVVLLVWGYFFFGALAAAFLPAERGFRKPGKHDEDVIVLTLGVFALASGVYAIVAG